MSEDYSPVPIIPEPMPSPIPMPEPIPIVPDPINPPVSYSPIPKIPEPIPVPPEAHIIGPMPPPSEMPEPHTMGPLPSPYTINPFGGPVPFAPPTLSESFPSERPPGSHTSIPVPASDSSPVISNRAWRVKSTYIPMPRPSGRQPLRYRAVLPKLKSRIAGGAPSNLGRQFKRTWLG